MEIKAMEITQVAEGEKIHLYLAVMSAEMLSERAKPDAFDAGTNPKGYQRRASDHRVSAIATYVSSHEGLLPTAVLLNVREGAEFEREGGNGTPVGTLRIPDEETLWIVDGQHRIAGIKASRERSGTDADYELPVVITTGIPRQDEMRLFHIVNSRAKSVPTDLAAELLRQAVLSGGRSDTVHSGRLSERDFRKAVGAQVGRHLNSTAGPWFGKIRLPNEARDVRQKPLQLNAIASSLEPVLRERFVASQAEREVKDQWPTISGWVHAYWSALERLMPEAFSNIEGHSVQRTAGVYAFHLLLPDVLDRCRERGSYSIDTMVSILKPLGIWVESRTWHREDGDPLTKSTGMATIRVLTENMRNELQPLNIE